MKQSQGKSEQSPFGRRYWLWVTRPEYYLDEDGRDREDLDPNSGVASDGWWTCHKDTREGDLIYLWRTSPRRDIGYLLQAASDAYSLSRNRHAVKRGWEYGCDYVSLYKFKKPIGIEDLHARPELQDWGAYRANFWRRVFEIPEEQWKRLEQLAIEKERGYRPVVQSYVTQKLSRVIELERDLEDALAADLSILRPFGYELRMFKDPSTGKSGRQFVCFETGGRIDLLCEDRQQKLLVVIELKNDAAGRAAYGQISEYLGWVKRNLAGKRRVVGLVISRGYDKKFEAALFSHDGIRHLDLTELGFE